MEYVSKMTQNGQQAVNCSYSVSKTEDGSGQILFSTVINERLPTHFQSGRKSANQILSSPDFLVMVISFKMKLTYLSIATFACLLILCQTSSGQVATTSESPVILTKEQLEKQQKEAKKKAEADAKEAKKKAEIDAKEAKKKAEEQRKQDEKLRKELGPDPINSTYDRFTDRSVISFYSKMRDELWYDGTALVLGAEYNFTGANLSSSQPTGRYFVTLAYVVPRAAYPMASHSFIILVDGERLDFGNLQVSRYNAASSEGILAPGNGLLVYTYAQVTRDVLTRLSSAKVLEARLNTFEFVVKPRYMNTLRDFLTRVPG